MWWHNVKISQLSNRSNLFPVYHSQMQSANHGFASKPDYLFQMCVKKGNHFSLMERNGCSKMEEWEDGVRDWWAAGRLTWEETLLMLLVAMLHAVSSTYSPVSILSTIAPFLSQNVYPIPLLFFTILVHIVTMTPFSFRHPVNLISFSSSSVHFCPPRCHLQHQAVLSIWHSEGNRHQSACQKCHSSNHRHGRSPLPSRNGQSQVREERITSGKWWEAAGKERSEVLFEWFESMSVSMHAMCYVLMHS